MRRTWKSCPMSNISKFRRALFAKEKQVMVRSAKRGNKFNGWRIQQDNFVHARFGFGYVQREGADSQHTHNRPGLHDLPISARRYHAARRAAVASHQRTRG